DVTREVPYVRSRTPHGSRSVALRLAGEAARADVLGVAADGLRDGVGEVGVAADEPGVELLREPEEVVRDEDLPARGGPGADADCGDRDAPRHLLSQRGEDLLEDDGEAAGLLQQPDVLAEGVGLLLLPRAHLVGPELVDALWREAEVPHHRDPRIDDAADG